MYFERYLAQPQLSPETVAPRFRISARTLQRHFEADGTSFSEYVLGRRLAHVHAALGDPRGDTRGIAELALAFGFGNISYFNRRFRARYGAAPSDIRNREFTAPRSGE